jgi:hypothetical protein
VSRKVSPLMVPLMGIVDLSSLVLYTPFDVVVTHMQRSQGQATYKGAEKARGTRLLGANSFFFSPGNFVSVVRGIYQAEGRRGFFRGFAAAALTYTPTSALWWPSYEIFKRSLSPAFLTSSELRELDESLARDADKVTSSSLNTAASRKMGAVVALSGVFAGKCRFLVLESSVPHCESRRSFVRLDKSNGFGAHADGAAARSVWREAGVLCSASGCAERRDGCPLQGCIAARAQRRSCQRHRQFYV